LARLPFSAAEEAEFLVSIGRSDSPFLISSTIFGGGSYLALLTNGKGFVGLETGFGYGDALAGVGVGLRHQARSMQRCTRSAFKDCALLLSIWDTGMSSACDCIERDIL
jgi:hypothetical protein